MFCSCTFTFEWETAAVTINWLSFLNQAAVLVVRGGGRARADQEEQQQHVSVFFSGRGSGEAREQLCGEESAAPADQVRTYINAMLMLVWYVCRYDAMSAVVLYAICWFWWWVGVIVFTGFIWAW